MIAPLRKTTQDGKPLKRPPRIEAEIACVLELSPEEIRARAALTDPAAEGYLSPECLVHLVRHDLDSPSRRLVAKLSPILLRRCDRQLRRSVRGFGSQALAEIREEVLGKLALLLVDPSPGADFLEVRFDLALKRLRIDACRRRRRRDRVLVAMEDATPADGGDALERLAPRAHWRAVSTPPTQEESLHLHQALSALSADERKALVLHRGAGIPINSKAPGRGTLVALLGVSERTVRNRLRSAEAKLSAFAEASP